MARLGDLVEQIRGVSYKPEDVYDQLSEDSITLLRANNIKDGRLNFDDVIYVDKKRVRDNQLLKAGDILICTSSGSKELVGKAAYVSKDLSVTFGAFCKVVRPQKIRSDYLGHFFNSPNYRRKISDSSAGANINNIRNEHIDELEISLPAMDEQEYVATALNKVSNLISLRKQQLAKLDELVKARFVEMFGDPIINDSKWQKTTIGKQFKVTSGGTPSTGEEAYWKGGTIPWIGSNMCQDIILYTNDGKFITEKGYAHSSAKWFCSGTVLVALVGATIGKTALLRFDTTANQNIAAIDVNGNEDFTSEYVFYHIQLQYDMFMEIGSGKFKMANQEFIRQLSLIHPPVEIQGQFSAFVEQIEKDKLTVQQSLDKLETLKKSLMQQYFGGK